MSFFSLALRACRLLRSDLRTGVTTDQWWPTGQCWNRHPANRSAFSEAPGIQIVVKR
jgi:hypothetical protein